MPHWKNLTWYCRRAIRDVGRKGFITKDEIHHSTLRALCRRDIFARLNDPEKKEAEYGFSYDAAHDLVFRPYDRNKFAPRRFLRCSEVTEQSHPDIYARAIQARANILAGRLCDGFDVETGEIVHAPIRLIEPDINEQYAVVDEDGATLWVDQSYEACRDWIREQVRMEREEVHRDTA